MPPILFSVGTHECLIQILGASFTTTISGYTEKCTAYIANIFNSYARLLDAMVAGLTLAATGRSLLLLVHKFCRHGYCRFF